MKIAVYQVDGTKYNGVQFPNIALMKISSYHKSLGDEVEWYKGHLFWEEYDKIYASKIFNFSEMPQITPNMVIGGTGIDFYNKLPKEIEDRLAALAAKTGRSKTYYAREAILEYLDDMEDIYLVLDRLENPGRIMTMEEVERELDLDD